MLNKKTNFLKFACMAMCVIMLAGLSSCKKDKDVRDGIVGLYRVVETVTGVQIDDYTMTITKSSVDPNGIILNNFFNISGWSLNATVSGNSITIPQQTYQLYGANGSGRRDGNTITFSYLVTETGGTQANVQATATKQ